MKHILNDLSEQEKNAIREQHTGGMKVMTENFSKLLNAKLGDAKPLVSEQTSNPYKVGQVIKAIRDKDQKEYTIKIVNVGDYYVVAKITGPGTYAEGGTELPLDGKGSFELTSNKPGQLSGNDRMGVFKIGGMTENFSKLGDVKPILSEQGTKKKHPYITKIGQVFTAIRDIDNKPYKLVVSTDPNRKDASGNYWTDIGFDITGPGEWEGKPLMNTGQFLTYDPQNPNVFWGNNALGYFTIKR